MKEASSMECCDEEIQLLWEDASEKMELKYETFKDFIEIDDSITTETINEDTIVVNWKLQNEGIINDNFEEELASVPIKSEAIKMIFKLKQLFKDHEDIPYLPIKYWIKEIGLNKLLWVTILNKILKVLVLFYERICSHISSS